MDNKITPSQKVKIETLMISNNPTHGYTLNRNEIIQ